ncbi:hypothetical protein [Aquabacter sp. L1I39]|nr:hypothetical protein [Aquabacter sp. L1I39]
MQTFGPDRTPRGLILWGMILVGLGLLGLMIAIIAVLMFGGL